MARFHVGHATHPDWRMALALADAQLHAAVDRAAGPAPTLGWCYLTDAYAPHAEPLLAELRGRWPEVTWTGCVGFGVAAGAAEYIDEPALALMLAPLPRSQFHLFHGAQPLPPGLARAALVHVDPNLPELGELVAELGQRVDGARLFGGLTWSRSGSVHLADGVWRGGFSGVGFTPEVALLTRVTQGCQPLGPVREITAATGNLVLALDGLPALPQLLADLGLDSLDPPRLAMPRLRATLVGLCDGARALLDRGGQFGGDTLVRPLVGVDPSREAVAVGERVQAGMRLGFARRDADTARRDLVRICAEIREELAESAGSSILPSLAGASIAGALYISCAGRGGAFFGGPSAELQLVQHALGDVPLVGFFAAGEISGARLHSHTGLLTVFTAAPGAQR